jgi:hypothetical protein
MSRRFVMNGGSSRMAQWLPAFAAALGLLAGIGGAYIGGKVANEGQQKQFENQRIAQLQDLLISNYGDYLGASERLAADFDLPDDVRSQVKKASDLVGFSAAEAQVHLVASDELWEMAKGVRQSFDENRAAYRAARNAFIERAQKDINEPE